MIPKIIHYCWFGSKPLPEEAKACIASWERYCPDFEIKLWNEENFAVEDFPFASSAMAAKKYAFVSDVCRVFVLYQHGGVYMDTDMELIKPIDELLDKKAFIGFEDDDFVAAGIIGCEKNSPFIAEVYQEYEKLPRMDFSTDEFLKYTIPRIITRILSVHQINSKNICNIPGVCTTFPAEYFYPKSYHTGSTEITRNSYGIHHYDASWLDEKVKNSIIHNQKKAQLNDALLKAKKDGIDSIATFNLVRYHFNISNKRAISIALKNIVENLMKSK